ncbi:MAG TPA: sugar phosphate isomerase/epimerase [Planctomycetaceae bacterium]|nr:sugar phosphate isomerase/epimerase [Planctomycetaceae bacterium]
MFVAATTRCFANLPLDTALQRLVDLEYSAVEIMIHESGGHLRPSAVFADLDGTVQICRDTRRLTTIGYSIDIEAPTETEYYQQFAACCRLAKATKVITLTVRASELGTPFNGEVERLRELVRIASLDGAVVGLLTEAGRISQDPATVKVLCDNVKGLGVTLDPSHFILGPHKGAGYDQIMEYVIHVRLRDTTRNEFQVRVGQGDVEYGRLLGQLAKQRYTRALAADIQPIPDVDQASELRKIRLLLESLL